MSAFELRQAAYEMRRDTFNGQTEDAAFLVAVADWLDSQARTIERNVEEGARKPGCHPTHPALAVARAYLGDPQ